jgi:lipopolysaccharide transport system ATP-binding protein
MSAITVSKVAKQFRLGETHDSLGDLLAGLTRRLRNRIVGRTADEPARSGPSKFWAVRDLDFTVAKGEAVGIIGPNGAGKSTVLKLLAGIIRPDRGTVSVNGRLAALIEVGAGFHGDLTGRENIFLNGAILGMSRAEIRSKLDAIVEFAGIGRFLDMPVKRYSSGMYARLGFSIAAHVDPDVLLVDEVLSVGDAVFRLRCLDRMRQLVDSGTTLVFVTHDLDQMQAICSRAIVLEHGSATFSGDAGDAVGQYLSAMSREYAHGAPDLMEDQDREGGDVRVVGLSFFDESGEEVVWTRSRRAIRAELQIRLSRSIPRLVVELNMRASLTDNLLSINSGRDGRTFDVPSGDHMVTLSLPSLPVCGGQYVWNVRVWDSDSGRAEVDTPFRYPLVIDDEGCKTGKLSLPHEWSLTTQASVKSAAVSGVGGSIRAAAQLTISS